VNERIAALGAQPVGGTPQELAAFVGTEITKWRKVIQDANVKLQQ
jgi:tripartite-type tricarboxylate transporter receptor subunit TctC